jgi:hypothetical protein
VIDGLIDMRKIKEVNNRYGFKIKEISYNNCLVDTGEEWLIEVTSPKQLILRHKNTRHNTDRYHVQGYFDNYYKVLKYIDNHKNKWNNTNCRIKKLEILYNKIKNQTSIISGLKT